MDKEIKFENGITFKYQHIDGNEEKAIERFQIIVPFEGKDRICNSYNTLFPKKGDMLDKDEFNKFINFLKSENVIDKEFFAKLDKEMMKLVLKNILCSQELSLQ